MKLKFFIACFAVCAVITGTAGMGETKVLSKSEPKVTQLKISHAGSATGGAKDSAWGVDSSYVGPGEIEKLVGVDIYIDDYKRIALVKITRISNVGDTITILFTNVLELSIQTLKPGTKRPHQKTPITIHTADSLTFP